MSTVIDENVVELKFDNAQFEAGVRESMQSIDNLEQKLDIEKGAENFKTQFSAMQIVAFTVISEITKSAINLGKNLNNMLFGQIKSGGFSRASNIEAAKFMLEGLGVTWKEIEEDINYGVADTAYGLDAAAKAASQLVASGVKFGQESEQMKNTLRGISGVAAMTNSTYEDTAAIFTTIAGQGRVMTMQLRQLEARGLNVAATMGEQMGKTEAEIRDMVTKGQIDFNTFAESMDQAFGSHAKDANKTLTGVLSNIRSALSKIGADFFTPIIQNEGPLVNMLDQIRLFLNLVRKYIQPATERLAKYTNLIITNLTKFFRSNLLSDWIDPLEGKTTKLSKKVTDFIDSVKRKVRQMANTILSYILPVVDAFKAVFNNSLIKSATNFNDTITTILKSVQLSSKGMQGLAKTFYGIFTVIKLVRNVFIMLVKAIIPTTQKCQSLLDIIFTLTGYVGDIVAKFAAWIYNTKILQTVIYTLGTACRGIASVIVLVASGIAKIFETIANSKVAATIVKVLAAVLQIMINTFNEGLYYINKFVEKLGIIPILIQAIADKFVSIFSKASKEISLFTIIADVFKALSKMFTYLLKSFKYLVVNLDKIPQMLLEIGRAIRETLSQFEIFRVIFSILDVIIGYLSKAVTVIKEMVSSMSSGEIRDFSEALSWLIIAVSASKASRGFTKLTKSITGFISAIKKGIFGVKAPDSPLDEVLQLVNAMATLAACAKILSTIPSGKLQEVKEALVFMWHSIALMYLIVGLVDGLCNTLAGVKRDLSQSVKVSSIAALFLAIAVSIKMIGDAIIQFEGISWETISDGLSRILVVITSLGGVATALSWISAKDLRLGFIGAATSLAVMGFAAKQIADALLEMSAMDANKIETAGYALMAAGVAMGALAAGISNLGLGNVLAFYIFVKTFNKALPEISKMSDALLSKVDTKKILEGLMTYKTIALTISAVLAAFLIIIGKFEVGDQFKAFASSFLIISIALIMMVEVCRLINKHVDEVERALPALGILIGFMLALEGFAAFTVNSKFKEFAASLGSVIIAVALLAALAYTLSEISDDSEKIFKASASLLSMSVIFGIMAWASGEARKVKIAPLVTMTLMIGVLAGALAGLTIATSYGDIEAAIENLITVMAALGAFLLFIERNQIFTKFNAKQKVGILTTIGAIAVIATAIGALAFHDPANLVTAAISLSAALFAFVGAIKILNTVKFTQKQAESVIILAGAMFIVGSTLSLISLIEWKKVIPGMVAMSTAMIAFGYALKIMGQTDVKMLKQSKNIIEIAGAMMIIATCMSMLAHFDWAKIVSSGVAMSAAMLSFSMVLKYVGNINSIDSKTIIKMIPLFGALLGIMGILILYQNAVKELDYKMLAASSIGLSTVMTAIAYSIKIASSLDGTTGTGFTDMMSAIAALGVLAYILQKYQNAVKDIKPSVLVASFVGLTTVFAAYTGMQYVMQLIADEAKKADAAKVAGLLVASLINLVLIAGALIFYQNAVKDIKPSVLVASFAGLTAVILAFSAMFLALSKIQNGGFKNSLGTIAILVTFVGVLTVLAVGLAKLSEIPWKNMIAPLASLLVVMGAFSGLIWFVSNKLVSPDITKIIALTIAAVSIYALCSSLKSLTELPLSSMVASVAMVFVLLTALTQLMTAINSISSVTAGTGKWYVSIAKQIMPLIIMLGMFTEVMGSIKILASMPWQDVLTACTSMYLVMTSLSAVMNSMSTFNPKGLIGVMATLAILGATMGILATFNWYDIAVSCGGMSLAMLVLAVVIKSIASDKFNITPKQATSIIKIAASLAILGAALSLLSHFDWKSILAACAGMSIAMIAYAAAMYIMSGMNMLMDGQDATTLIKMAVSLVPLAYALSLLAKYPFLSIAQSLGGLISAIAAFSVVIALLNKVDFSTMTFASVNFKQILKYAVGFVAFSAMLVILSKELNEVTKADWPSILSSLISAGIAMSILLGIGMLLSRTGLIGAVTLGALAIALVAVGVSLIPLSNNLDKVAQAMLTMKNVGVGEIVSDIYAIKDALTELASTNSSVDVIAQIFQSLTDSLNNSNVDVTKATALTNMLNSIKDYASQSFELGTYQAGVDFAVGFVNGLNDSQDMMTEAVRQSANNVINAFREVTGWHSPWSTMVAAGRDMIYGLAGGIFQNASISAGTAYIAGYNTVAAEAQGMSDAQNSVNNALSDTTDAVVDEVTDAKDEVESELSNWKLEDSAYNDLITQMAKDLFNGKDIKDLTQEEAEMLAGVFGDAQNAFMNGIGTEASDYFISNSQMNYGIDITPWVNDMQTLGETGETTIKDYTIAMQALANNYGDSISDIAANSRDEFGETNRIIQENSKDLGTRVGDAWLANWDFWANGYKNVAGVIEASSDSSIASMFGMETNYEDMMDSMTGSLGDFNYAIGDTESEADLLHQQLVSMGLVEDEQDEKTRTLQEEYTELAGRIRYLMKAYQYASTYGNASDEYLADLQADLKATDARLREIDAELNKGISSTSVDTSGTDEATKAAEKYADAMDDLKDSIEDALKSNEHFNRTVTDSSKTIISNLKSQVSGVTEWANDLVKLASRGASQALVEELGEMGTDGYSMIQAYLTMTDEQLAEVNEIYENRATLEKQALAKVNASYALAGNQNASSYLKSLGYSLSQVEQLVAEEAEAANKQFNENLVKFADAEPYTDEYNELKTYFQELGYTTKDVASMIEKANGNINVSLRNLEMEEAFKKVEAAYYSMYSIISDASDPFTEFTRSFEVTKESLFKNLNSQVNGFAEWSNKLIILANRGVSRGIIGALEEAGPESVDKIDAMLDMTSEELEKYMELWENTESNIEDTSRSMMMALALTGDEDAIEYFKTLGMSIEDVQKQADILDAQTFQLTNMKNAAKEVQEEFSNLYDTIKGQIDIFEAFDTSAEMSGDEMLENMQSQIDGVKEWSKNLTELAGRGMSEGLLKELSDLGPDGYEKVAAFVDMTDDQLREANDLFAESLTLPMSTAGEVMSSYAKAGDQAAADFINSLGLSANNAEAVGKAFVDAFSLGISNELDLAKDSGSDLMSGFLSGLDEMGENVLTESDTLSTNILDTMREVLGIHSPSKETTAMGKYLCQGFSDGMHNNKTKVVADAISMGKDIVNGLINGINNQVNRAYSSVTSFANKILTVARNTLGINSPSKKFAEIGMYSVMGMCDGIKNYAYLASDAANELSNDTLNIVQEAIDSILEIINSDEDALVIRPILDLSNIQEGANKISSMFKQKELSMAIDADGNQNGSKTGIGASYTFNQYNTSPKALDRIEIYRQTKNQFSMLRGMV